MIDFEIFFKKYETLVQASDKIFEQVKKDYPECVKCVEGCSDCCHALFDIVLVEAIYINHKFREKYQGAELEAYLEKINSIDRQIYKLKKKAFKEQQEGKDEDQILNEMAEVRVRCPLLNDSHRCDLYEYRPITCRLYGIPTAIGGRGHTCGLSGFEEGKNYPTANMDVFHKAMLKISQELVTTIGSKYYGLPEMLVPLSTALLTTYDEEYLGISGNKDSDSENKKRTTGNDK
jgi:Fe-S-cluster containining protein